MPNHMSSLSRGKRMENTSITLSFNHHPLPDRVSISAMVIVLLHSPWLIWIPCPATGDCTTTLNPYSHIEVCGTYIPETKPTIIASPNSADYSVRTPNSPFASTENLPLRLTSGEKEASRPSTEEQNTRLRTLFSISMSKCRYWP